MISEALKELIKKNRLAFSNYNMVRMREALRYFSKKKLQLFLKIPFYLHINRPQYPGCIDTKSKPYGIWNFENSGFYKEAVSNQLFPKSVLETCRTDDPAILGVYHIGSLGTFTQSSGSDFDFWVMIDKKKFSKERYEALEKKLNAIVGYCRENHDQKVSFFIMDQRETRSNKFLPFTGEESISAPKVFLKEEFYRTFLMIAGKIPIWAVLPSELSTDNSLKTQAIIRQLLLDHSDLIDLGQITELPRQDILKGLLWHICKSKADPVKALIKATMIFSYGFSHSPSDVLLCEKIKQGYAKAGIDDYGVDPYKALFDRILSFHEQEDPKGLALVKNAIFYRLCGYPQVNMPKPESPKRILLEKYIRIWSLSKHQVNKLLSYASWSESEKLVLERSFIQRLTQMVNHAKNSLGSADDIIKSDEQRNWTILKNKTKERLGSDTGKVNECSTYLKRKTIHRLTIIHENQICKLDLQTLDGEDINGIYQHQYFLNVFGWVMENQLYKRRHASFEFKSSKKIYEASSVPIDLDHLYLKFLPLKPLSDDVFSQAPVCSRMLVLVCYDFKRLIGAQIMVSNTWGELFVTSVALKKCLERNDQIRQLARAMNKYPVKDIRIHICQYGQMLDPDIVYQLKKAYTTFHSEKNVSKKKLKKPFLDRL